MTCATTSFSIAEFRGVPRPEIRTIAGQQVLQGYAAVFNSPSELLGNPGRQWTEVVRRGAFTRAIAAQQNIICWRQHGQVPGTVPLARTADGTLTLAEDATGLFYSCPLPDTAQAARLATAIRNGTISGSSFAFRVSSPLGEAWSIAEDGGALRQLLSVDLIDVAPVTDPAYASTSVWLTDAVDADQPVEDASGRDRQPIDTTSDAAPMRSLASGCRELYGLLLRDPWSAEFAAAERRYIADPRAPMPVDFCRGLLSRLASGPVAPVPSLSVREARARLARLARN